MVREFVSGVALFQELTHLGLAEEEILDRMIEAKSHPGKIIEVLKYKFRYNETTAKFEDNQVKTMINRVANGEKPKEVIDEDRCNQNDV